MGFLRRDWPVVAMFGLNGLISAPFVLAYAPEPWLALATYLLFLAAVVNGVFSHFEKIRHLFTHYYVPIFILMGVSVTAGVGPGGGVPFLPGLTPLGEGVARQLMEMGIFGVMVPISLLFLLAVMHGVGTRVERVGVYFTLLGSNFGVWAMAAAHADYLAWAIMGFALLVVLTHSRVGMGMFTAAAALLAAGAMVREVYMPVPYLVAFGLFAVWYQRSLIMLGMALAASVWALLGGTALPDGGVPLWSTVLVLASLAVLLGYHWRWWSPLVHYVLGAASASFVWLVHTGAEPGAAGLSAAVLVLPALVLLLMGEAGRLRQRRLWDGGTREVPSAR